MEDHGDSNTFIIIVNRGGCSFATKVYLSQMVGASFTIIINHESADELDKELESQWLVDDKNRLG